jgi:hypothetical protein
MKTLAVMVLLVWVLHAKELLWQTGSVSEVASQRFEDPIDDKGVVYTIHSGKFDYVAVERSMAHHRLKDHRAEPGDSVKFALKGEITLVLIGSDGKEHKLQLLKQSERAGQ